MRKPAVVKEVNILGLDYSDRRASPNLGNPVTEDQILRDWHIWLKSFVIKRPCMLEGDSYNQTIDAMEQLLIDAWEAKKPDEEIIFGNAELSKHVKELVATRQQLAKFNQAEGFSILQQSGSEETFSDVQQHQKLDELKSNKAKSLDKAKEAFEEQNLSLETLQKFWRNYLIPTGQQEHAEKYIDFLTKYAHQGGVLHAHMTGLQKYVAQREGRFAPQKMQYLVTVSGKDIVIETTYFMSGLRIANDENNYFYQFNCKQDKSESALSFVSQVKVGLNRRSKIDVDLIVGFGKDVTKQIRENCDLEVHPFTMKEGQKKNGDKFTYREEVNDSGKVITSPCEKATIIQHFLMWLENFIEQIKNDFKRLLKSDSKESELPPEQQSLLTPEPQI
ncbi:MAG: hypothetical protein GKR77_05535 [Legionellales bacterium]|nr:hypothetical protein [Legionellales bacterium]